MSAQSLPASATENSPDRGQTKAAFCSEVTKEPILRNPHRDPATFAAKRFASRIDPLQTWRIGSNMAS